jgi:hypothetical protein
LGIFGQTILEIIIDFINTAKALQELIGVGSALIDVSSLDEKAHVFKDFVLFFR